MGALLLEGGAEFGGAMREPDLRAIEFAAQRGVKSIQTDNEENNPMFQLNLALGFKPVPAWISLEKRLHE